MVLILRTGIPYREGGSDRTGVQLGLNGARRPDLFSVVELVALRRVAPRPAAQRLPANRAVRASRSAAARGGVVAARQPLPLDRYSSHYRFAKRVEERGRSQPESAFQFAELPGGSR